jgi:signal transduction histidine kinase/DNA-binding response OmpR family regulator/HPt (histidine-containing phosphotransfer) domain-containing protein
VLSFRDLSIKRKLQLIIMLTAGAALLVACGAFLAYDRMVFRSDMRNDLSILAEIVGSNSTAALSFNDPKSAEEILKGLKAKTHIVAASIYTNDGRVFGRYVRADVQQNFQFPPPQPNGSAFGENRLVLFRRIILDGQGIGTVYLLSDLEEMRSRGERFTGIVAIIMLASSVLAFLLTSKLQQPITKPIMDLAETARVVSVEKNYAVRAVKYNQDELGVLIDGFNEMLSQIQHRDQQLQGHRDDLEKEVAARTAMNVQFKEAKDRAEDANRSKSEFLANMSHEIRTPMNGIIGMTELALDTELTAEQREYLSLVKVSADSLLGVINDILDFSKIEAGKMELDPVAFNFRDSLGETVKTLALRADQKGLELAYHVKPEVPEEVWADPTRLRQIVVNLLGNALKFTEKGEVILEVGVESRTETGFVLHFTVTDTGIGIPAEKRQKIFEPFTQADGSMTRKYGGTGLGLTITSQIVQMMGGRIWAESEPGKGSTFHFTAQFDLPKTPTAKVIPAEAGRLRNLPVLVVDDNATNRRILKEMLVQWEMKPTLADGGWAALACLYRARNALEPFTLVLTDAHMPDMDGFSLAERIKQSPELAPVTTIMMLTSGGRPGDAARCRELNITAYLVKPIKQTDLLQAILIAVGQADRKEAHPILITRHSLRQGQQKLRFLLVEDNMVNQALAARLLEKWGHSVVAAGNGREALATLEKANFTGFDLVLMDIQMPEMDGFETTAAIREKEKTLGTHLPIIAMTAHVMKGDRERCLEAGMDDYVSKPIHAQKLLVAIESWAPATVKPGVTPEKGSAQAPFVPSPAEISMPAQNASLAGPGVPGKKKEVVDWDQALARVDGDRQVLADITRLFRDQSRKLLSDVREAISRQDAKALEFAAHTLKGSVGNFTSTGPFESALELEKMGREANLGQAAQAYLMLEAELEQVMQALAEPSKEVSS